MEGRPIGVGGGYSAGRSSCIRGPSRPASDYTHSTKAFNPARTAFVVPEESPFHGQAKPWDGEADSGFPRNPQVSTNRRALCSSPGSVPFVANFNLGKVANRCAGSGLSGLRVGIQDIWLEELRVCKLRSGKFRCLANP